MELRLPAPHQLRTVYERHLRPAFPDAERKPLRVIEEAYARGEYRPWCLFDGEEPAGEAFVWQGEPGWAMLDYLCVPPERRNCGLGAQLLQALLAAERGVVLFGEAESPEEAPDDALARRRLGFYRRCGARFAGFRTEVFGVVYRLFYWADRPLSDEALCRACRAVYRRGFPPDKFDRYLRIPRAPDATRSPCTPWEQ